MFIKTRKQLVVVVVLAFAATDRLDRLAFTSLSPG